MEKHNLIKQCRYYKGEKVNPFKAELTNYEIDKSNLPVPEQMKTEYHTINRNKFIEMSYKSLFWECEKYWVDFSINNEQDYFKQIISEYENTGLSDLCKNDKTPRSLKALIFNRFEYWIGGTTDEFKEIYTKYY